MGYPVMSGPQTSAAPTGRPSPGCSVLAVGMASPAGHTWKLSDWRPPRIRTAHINRIDRMTELACFLPVCEIVNP